MGAPAQSGVLLQARPRFSSLACHRSLGEVPGEWLDCCGFHQTAGNELKVTHPEARSVQARQERPRLVGHRPDQPLPDVAPSGAC